MAFDIFGCTYKAISTRYKICFTPKSLNCSMGASLFKQKNTVAHNCHGKTKNLTAKTKTSRENQNPHGKTKYFTAKTKYLKAEANNHSKTKAILFLL